MEHDFKITISVVDGEFNIDATGDIVDIVIGGILAIAATMESSKNDDISDAELEAAVLLEYRRAREFVKGQSANFEVNMK